MRQTCKWMPVIYANTQVAFAVLPLDSERVGGDLFFTSEHEIESVCVTGRQVCGCRVKEAGGGGGGHSGSDSFKESEHVNQK